MWFNSHLWPNINDDCHKQSFEAFVLPKRLPTNGKHLCKMEHILKHIYRCTKFILNHIETAVTCLWITHEGSGVAPEDWKVLP